MQDPNQQNLQSPQLISLIIPSAPSPKPANSRHNSNYNSRRHSLPSKVSMIGTSAIDQIQQHLQQNQQNIMNMENFLESKRMEIAELQDYLVREFEDIELWRGRRELVMRVFASGSNNEDGEWGDSISSIFRDIKVLLQNIVKQYKNIFQTLLVQMTQIFNVKLMQKDRQLWQKQLRLQQSAFTINKLKNQLNKLNINKSSTTTLRQLSRQVSLKKINSSIINNRYHMNNINSNNYYNDHDNRCLSKSTFLEYHVHRLKSKDKQNKTRVEFVGKSPHFQERDFERQKERQRQKERDKGNQGYLKAFKINQQCKRFSKSPVTKKVLYQVHKNPKQDWENINTKVPFQMDHKRYVKQKIQCLKSKNSMIFNQYQPLKAEKKF